MSLSWETVFNKKPRASAIAMIKAACRLKFKRECRLVGPLVLLVCRKKHLYREVVPCHSRYGTTKIPLGSEAVSHEQETFHR